MAAISEGVVSSISGKTLEKARRELSEVPEQRAETLQDFRMRLEDFERDPVQNEAGLVFSRKDDRFLLRFLRARKFVVERAVTLCINYHKYHHKYADLLQDFHPKALERVLRAGIFGVLNSPLNDGSKALLIYPSRWDPDSIAANDCFKLFLLILEKLLDDEETQVHGISIFDNLDGISLSLMLSFMRTEHIQRRVLVELQDAFPIRFKALHLVHQPWYVSTVMSLVKPFLKQKHRDRIHKHGSNLGTIHQLIHPDLLPLEFGGILPPLGADNLISLFDAELSSHKST